MSFPDNYERKRQGFHFEYHCIHDPQLAENRLLMNLTLNQAGISILYNTAPDCAMNYPEELTPEEIYELVPLPIEDETVQVHIRAPVEKDSNIKYLELKKFTPGYLGHLDKMMATWAQAVLGKIERVIIGSVENGSVSVRTIDEYTIQNLEGIIKRMNPHWNPQKSWNSLSTICTRVKKCIGNQKGFFILKYNFGILEIHRVDGKINVPGSFPMYYQKLFVHKEE
jgi:rhodanese-related sulfurtransferase